MLALGNLSFPTWLFLDSVPLMSLAADGCNKGVRLCSHFRQIFFPLPFKSSQNSFSLIQQDINYTLCFPLLIHPSLSLAGNHISPTSAKTLLFQESDQTDSRFVINTLSPPALSSSSSFSLVSRSLFHRMGRDLCVNPNYISKPTLFPNLHSI